VLPALILSAALLATAQDTPQTNAPQTNAPQTNAPASPAAPEQQQGGAVSVDAYHRDYEGPKTSEEARFDSGIWAAYNAKTSQAGDLEGTWVVSAADGRKLVSLELRSTEARDGRLEGAWRSLLPGYGLNDSGFVSDLSMSGRNIEINYFAPQSHAPTVLQLRKDSSGLWRGNMLDPLGHRTAIVMREAAQNE
jgi:hypothetical protein